MIVILFWSVEVGIFVCLPMGRVRILTRSWQNIRFEFFIFDKNRITYGHYLMFPNFSQLSNWRKDRCSKIWVINSQYFWRLELWKVQKVKQFENLLNRYFFVTVCLPLLYLAGKELKFKLLSPANFENEQKVCQVNGT